MRESIYFWNGKKNLPAKKSLEKKKIMQINLLILPRNIIYRKNLLISYPYSYYYYYFFLFR